MSLSEEGTLDMYVITLEREVFQNEKQQKKLSQIVVVLLIVYTIGLPILLANTNEQAIKEMFRDSAATSLDLSSFDTSKVATNYTEYVCWSFSIIESHFRKSVSDFGY
ncbi:hypothetical protein CYG98_14310 [Listeria monocytogenes serotype 1/2a]|nr:hypothetical protein [Listeria monocytogenes serotype 1/2a]